MSADVRLAGDELIAHRHLAAEPQRVWEAFVTSAGIAAFWGGSHAVVPVDSVTVDLRVGGEFALDTRAPDGAARRLRFVYTGIEPPRRLAFHEPVTGLLTTVTLTASDTGTDVVVHQRLLPPELRTAQAATGLASILDALAAHLRVD